MTNVKLSDKVIKFLSLGHNYCPFTYSDGAILHLDFLKFYRQLRFKYFFNQNPRVDNRSNYIENIPSNSDPPVSSNQCFETFITNAENVVTQVNETSYLKKRIQHDQSIIRQLVFLKQKHNLFFCHADKGGTLIVMHDKNYNDLVQKHLTDSRTYKELSSSIDQSIQADIHTLIQRYSTYLFDDEIRYFLNHKHQPSYFYILPKIHKSEQIKKLFSNSCSSYLQVGFMPDDLCGRPIVSNINSPTCRISHFLQKVLSPLPPKTFSYVKDTFHLLERLDKNPRFNFIFASFDVVSLYTTIPNDLGIEAIQYWVKKFANDIRPLPTSLIVAMLEIVLKQNTFQYRKKYFMQINGTAMGTKVAPTYANLVLAYLENKLLNQCIAIFGEEKTTFIRNNYFRFLDDILVVWNTAIGELSIFADLLNQLHPSIQFTYSSNKDRMPFLDVLLIQNKNKIVTDIYRKETDAQQYLHFYSNHPGHTKRNIPYNLAHRIHKIVSDEAMRTQRLADLKTVLQSLKYPEPLINDALSKSSCTTLSTKLKENLQPIVFTHSSENTKYYHDTLQKHILPITNNFFNNALKIIKSTRQPFNLVKTLNTNSISQVKKCNMNRCRTCPLLIEKRTSICINNNQVNFNKNMNCRSKNVIYVLFCNKCNAFYVGETSLNLNLRVNLHRQHINNSHYGILNVSTHIRNCGGFFKIIPIFQLPSSSAFLRKKQETYFIHLLKPELNSAT